MLPPKVFTVSVPLSVMDPMVAFPVPPPDVLTVIARAVAEVAVVVMVAPLVAWVKPAVPVPAVSALMAMMPAPALIFALSVMPGGTADRVMAPPAEVTAPLTTMLPPVSAKVIVPVAPVVVAWKLVLPEAAVEMKMFPVVPTVEAITEPALTFIGMLLVPMLPPELDATALMLTVPEGALKVVPATFWAMDTDSLETRAIVPPLPTVMLPTWRLPVPPLAVLMVSATAELVAFVVVIELAARV